jgi:hypothetical protein
LSCDGVVSGRSESESEKKSEKEEGGGRKRVVSSDMRDEGKLDKVIRNGVRCSRRKIS